MKKLWLIFSVVFIILSISVPVINSYSTHTIHSSLWTQIVEKLWESPNGAAGEGLYFYTRDNKPICAQLIYGFGADIGIIHESNVELINNDSIQIELLQACGQTEKLTLTLMINKLVTEEKQYALTNTNDIRSRIDTYNAYHSK